MNTWILIVLTTFSGYVSGVTIDHIEFKSNQQCQKAASYLNTNSRVNTFCVENK